jgi:hypothetical protein
MFMLPVVFVMARLWRALSLYIYIIDFSVDSLRLILTPFGYHSNFCLASFGSILNTPALVRAAPPANNTTQCFKVGFSNASTCSTSCLRHEYYTCVIPLMLSMLGAQRLHFHDAFPAGMHA